MPLAEQLADIISRLFTHCQEKDSRFVAKYGVSFVESRCLRILAEEWPIDCKPIGAKNGIDQRPRDAHRRWIGA